LIGEAAGEPRMSAEVRQRRTLRRKAFEVFHETISHSHFPGILRERASEIAVFVSLRLPSVRLAHQTSSGCRSSRYP
jgi:hypothetical protein